MPVKQRKVLNFNDERFTRVTKVVLDDNKYLDKPIQKLVYAILCMYADNETMKSHPSIQTLAKKCCCSENSIRSALKRLEELELISVKRRKYGEKNYSNEYTIWEPPKWFYEGTSNHEGGYFTS